jgi:hypothetical protein
MNYPDPTSKSPPDSLPQATWASNENLVDEKE